MTKKWTVADAPMPKFAAALQNIMGITFTSQAHLDSVLKELNKNRPSKQKKQLGGPIQRSKDDQPLAYGNPAMGGPVAARGGYVKKYARGGGIRKIKG